MNKRERLQAMLARAEAQAAAERELERVADICAAADGQQAQIFCHRCGSDQIWVWNAAKGSNYCQGCGVSWFAMDHNVPGKVDLFGVEQVPGGCACSYCAEDREKGNQE